MHYMEGLAWVLQYYYQGVRSCVSMHSRTLTTPRPDAVVDMVLSVPFCPFRRRLRGRKGNED